MVERKLKKYEASRVKGWKLTVVERKLKKSEVFRFNILVDQAASMYSTEKNT